MSAIGVIAGALGVVPFFVSLAVIAITLSVAIIRVAEQGARNQAALRRIITDTYQTPRVPRSVIALAYLVAGIFILIGGGYYYKTSGAPKSDTPAPDLSAHFTQMVQLVEVRAGEHFLDQPVFPEPTTYVFAQVRVTNKGGPSTAEDWSMWLTINGEDVRGVVFPEPDFYIHPNPSESIKYTQDEAIYNASVRSPITQSEPIRGFIIARFRQPSDVVENNLGSLQLRFKDVSGKEVRSDRETVGHNKSGWFEVVPGVGRIQHE